MGAIKGELDWRASTQLHNKHLLLYVRRNRMNGARAHLLVFCPYSWDTANILATARTDAPSWRSCTTCATWQGCRSCYQQWQGHKWKPKVIRRDNGRRNGLLPPPAKQFSFLVLVLLLPLCTKVEEMNSHWLTYPNQTDWHPWSLTDCVQSSVPFENLWNKHAKQDSFSLNADALLCLILAKAKSNNW